MSVINTCGLLRHGARLVAALMCGLVLRAAHATDSATLAGRASVIDGDTIELHGQRLRLNGIDAVESGQICGRDGQFYRCGQEAAFVLADTIAAASVSCRQTDLDRYGRIVAICSVAGEDIGAMMVREGWALAYRQYSLEYVEQERAARAERRGIWRGEFVQPWEWRAGKRLLQEDTAYPTGTEPAASGVASGCVIKGNISRDGERIYHVPGQQAYAKTVINEASSERWFCTEDEAVAAGWRKARN